MYTGFRYAVCSCKLAVVLILHRNLQEKFPLEEQASRLAGLSVLCGLSVNVPLEVY